MPRFEPHELSTIHEAMADYLIMNPTATNIELAIEFSRTPVWVGYVRNSDMFKVLITNRKNSLLDPILTMTLEQKILAITEKSLDVVMEKLETGNSADLALKTLETIGKVQGYGARQAGVTINNVNAGQVQQTNIRPIIEKDEWLKNFAPGYGEAEHIA